MKDVLTPDEIIDDLNAAIYDVTETLFDELFRVLYYRSVAFHRRYNGYISRYPSLVNSLLELLDREGQLNDDESQLLPYGDTQKCDMLFQERLAIDYELIEIMLSVRHPVDDRQYLKRLERTLRTRREEWDRQCRALVLTMRTIEVWTEDIHRKIQRDDMEFVDEQHAGLLAYLGSASFLTRASI